MTGENEAGRSLIQSDGPAPNVVLPDHSPMVAQVLWATGKGAAPGDEPAPASHQFGFHSEGGTILRIVDFPPDENCDPGKVTTFLDENEVRDADAPRHFWFHKTPSLDYAIVLEGEIYAMMDEGETLLRQGDVLIQRATNHSWSNRSDKMCRMAFVLVALGEGEAA
ncbi:cupin domain-containing protein [Sphingopyxis sp. GC21]|uniref:cupin domain-containing protein n=1 Tax=Sphingopyxis sp. GC21 TaxID=2933562 RepID=UPI0021E3980D|nr:cupin domain-containing protein [Sphingopyxis sp. GC21]